MRRSTFLLVFNLGLASVCGAQEHAASAFAHRVPPPNGVDDTAVIQTALDACVAHGPACTVQLAQGTYRTRQLVAYDFRGTFRGMGKDHTTIEALDFLPVNIPDIFLQNSCLPDTTTCLWPSLIIFVDGDISIADLSIKITAAPGTATVPWSLGGSLFTALVDAIRVMGQRRTNVRMDRVAIEGLPDASPTSFGFNVLNGILYAGELPRSVTPFDHYFLSGHLTVRNSSFKGMVDGVGQDGFFKDSQVTIGGSPLAGNEFENVVVGIWIESAAGSVFDISHNRSTGTWNAMRVDPWLPVFVPDKPSQYLIHDNIFTTAGPFLEALHLENPADNPWIRAAVYHNRIESTEALAAGIAAYNTQGTAIWGNKISGTGATAIALLAGAKSAVIGNDVRHFVVDPSFGAAQIYLDQNTQRDLVVCSRSSDTVLDLGTGNKVVRCQE